MAEPLVLINHLAHTYLAGTPLATRALVDANLRLEAGTITALVGPSGAGKSTLLHFVNALNRPAAAGKVLVFGQDTSSASLDTGSLRRRIGLAMQYPHQQLFERFVGDDVAYGPRQTGLQGTALREAVYTALSSVGLDPAIFVDRYTFSLSGGEMRRVALAGTLVMQPELLIFDEVTTGLDPLGRRQVHDIMRKLREQGITLLFASNDMDEVAEMADQVTVLYQGRTVAAGTPVELFSSKPVEQWGLLPPAARQIGRELQAVGVPVPDTAVRLEEVEEVLWQAWKA